MTIGFTFAAVVICLYMVVRDATSVLPDDETRTVIWMLSGVVCALLAIAWR